MPVDKATKMCKFHTFNILIGNKIYRANPSNSRRLFYATADNVTTVLKWDYDRFHGLYDIMFKEFTEI